MNFGWIIFIGLVLSLLAIPTGKWMLEKKRGFVEYAGAPVIACGLLCSVLFGCCAVKWVASWRSLEFANKRNCASYTTEDYFWNGADIEIDAMMTRVRGQCPEEKP